MITSTNWKEYIPEPVFDEDQGLIELYYKAWELAQQHISYAEGVPQTPYMDEGFADDRIWIWDTCFMVLFCKYMPDYFPGVESLKNFYEPMHDGVETAMKIQHLDNPPLFAWCEYENAKFTADKKHLKWLINDKQYLQKHYNWFENTKIGKPAEYGICDIKLKKYEKGFTWHGCPNGMDNTPRMRGGDGQNILWLDAICQQALSALYIGRMANILGDNDELKKWTQVYEGIKDTVNSCYWNEQDGMYYDIYRKDLTHSKVLTPASFWPLFAEIASQEQAERVAESLKKHDKLGGERPWGTVARDDQDYVDDYGCYWRGSVWLPTAYMGIKSLDKYNLGELADQTARKLLTHMKNTYLQYTPHTIWECYSPSKDEPAHTEHGGLVRPDFCGWSALGPISLFIENVLGLYDVNAWEKTVSWRVTGSNKTGIKKLRFADVITDLVYNGDNTISTNSNQKYKLKLNDKVYDIKEGMNTIVLSD